MLFKILFNGDRFTPLGPQMASTYVKSFFSFVEISGNLPFWNFWFWIS